MADQRRKRLEQNFIGYIKMNRIDKPREKKGVLMKNKRSGRIVK